MRCVLAVLIFAASVGAATDVLARPGTPNEVWAGIYETPIARLPRVTVSFRNTASEDVSFWVEWTENGVQKPAPRAGQLTCPSNSAQAYHCNIFTLSEATGFRGHALTRDREYPHAVIFKDLEFDSRYCFRLAAQDKEGVNSKLWSAWACTKTPSPPPMPGAPPKVQVTFLPGTSGRGQVGPGTPPRALIEWATPQDRGWLGSFVVETFDAKARRWHGDVPGRGHVTLHPSAVETTIDLLAEVVDPKKEAPRYRLCSVNVSGRACTTAVAGLLLQPATPAKPIGSARAAAKPITPKPTPSSTPNAGSAMSAAAAAATPIAGSAVTAMTEIDEAMQPASQASTAQPVQPPPPANTASTSTALATRTRAYAQQASTTEREQREQQRKKQEQLQREKQEQLAERKDKENGTLLGTLIGGEPVADLVQSADNPATPTPPLEPAQKSSAATGSAATATASASRSEEVTLNPQPLPPKTTVLKPRETTVLPSGPMQTTTGSNRSANPQGQIQGTAGQLATGAAAGATSQEIQTVELLCQGGDSLRIESKGAKQNAGGGSSTLMHLYFSPAFKNGQGGRYPAAGPEGKGLLASSCSFADREFTMGDPQAIYFETAPYSSEAEVKRMLHDADADGKPDARTLAETRPDEKSIPIYLSVPDHYWSFTAYRTNYGHFVATAHGPWKPRSATAIIGTVGADAERDSRTTIGRLHDIKVIPELRGVGFRFIARPNALPFVEIGKEKPIKGMDGIWVVRDPLRMSMDRDNKNSSATVTTYVGASRPQNLMLDQGTQYHYIVTVPESGTSAKPQQKTGTFRTLTRTASVIFTGIHVLNDSDEETDGDLTFGFFANPGESSQVQKRWDEQTWASGPRRRIDERLVVHDAPERLRIVVSARDDDKSQRDICIQLPLEPNNFDALRPRRNNCYEVNFAKAEIDLSKPSPTGGSFNLNSFGLGPHGVTLIYTVSGYVEVTQTP